VTRLLGVDFGSVRIGLAVTDPDRKIASPLSIYTRRDSAADAAFFQELAAEHDVGLFVVSLPIHLSGEEGEKARQARAFGQWLQEVTARRVVFWDERFTTVQAESALWDARLSHKQRKQRRDKVAAQMLLQAYLEAGCPEGETATQQQPDKLQKNKSD
jgi:putative Holliday junction resolvase